jgi:hypothetical protein
MALLRRKRRADAAAHVDFYTDSEGRVDAAWPRWDGDVSMLMDLPAAAFDEYVAYAYPPEGVIAQLESFIVAASESDSPDDLLWEDVEVVFEPPPNRRPAASMTSLLRMEYEKQRLWVKSEYSPKQAREVLMDLGYRVYWDWVVGVVGAERAALDSLIVNLAHQCDYYREFRVAQDFFLKDIGKAPFYGAMKGSSDRLRGEIAAAAGLTVEQFDALPDGERQMILKRHTAATLDDWTELQRGQMPPN